MSALEGEAERAWAIGLEGIEGEALAALVSRTRIRRLTPGQVLYEQGDVARRPALYVVVSGLLAVHQRSAAGGRRLLAVLAAGNLAGEVGVLDPRPRSTRTEALVQTTVAEARRTDLLAWLAEFPSGSGPLIRAVSRRVQHAEDALIVHTALGAADRVGRALLELADRWGGPGKDGSVVVSPLTQDQLAGLVGCSREATNKALRHLAGLGLVVAARRRVVLLDLPGLHNATLGQRCDRARM